MDRSSRFGVKDAAGDNPGEFMLLALVVSVMSAVKAEAVQPPNLHPPDPEVANLLAQFPSPCEQLTPEQVVKVQLSAFKINDAADQGLRKAYEFASPESRIVAGPLERFAVLVRNPVYVPLLGFENVSFGPMQVIANEAEQCVSILASSGVAANYRFRLSLQQFGDYLGCWMTDRVEPL
ncbi:MAG: DUF4864 domain-containing protein [Candidatus Sumerlaeaceae bacterium]